MRTGIARSKTLFVWFLPLGAMSSSTKMSDYEERRLKNIADNKRVLAELGLLNPVSRIMP